jgi:hypothetical protein
LSPFFTVRKTLPDRFAGGLARQARAGAELALHAGLAEGLAHAHHLAGGLHLRPRMVSTPGNLTNGNTASLTLKYGG